MSARSLNRRSAPSGNTCLIGASVAKNLNMVLDAPRPYGRNGESTSETVPNTLRLGTTQTITHPSNLHRLTTAAERKWVGSFITKRLRLERP